jgi:hypothetical protein
MSKIKVGDLVTYTGDTWPSRKGWKGQVTCDHTQNADDKADGGYYSVKFDGYGSVNCYGKSLTKREG